MTRFLLFYIFLHYHAAVLVHGDATFTFRCHNTEDEIDDITVSTYVVNNGIQDCVSGRDESIYAQDANVNRNGMVFDDGSGNRVYPFALSCLPGNPLANIFPDSQFACPGDFSGKLYDCDKLCDGYLQCENGWDEDVCFSSGTASCVSTRDLPEWADNNADGLNIYPRQCEEYCKKSTFEGVPTWYAITPGSGDEPDSCLCYISGSIPAALSWDKCDEPCYYGNGFIPCGSSTHETSVVGQIRTDQNLETSQCTVTAPSCVSPLASETLTVTCPSMEEFYSNGDQTLYKVEITVMDSRCYVSNQERDGTNGDVVTFVMPENVHDANIKVSVSTKLGEISYKEKFDFCPKKALSIEITGSEFQPTGLPTDLSMTVYGGEYMRVSLWLENEQGTSSPQIIENSLSLVSTLGSCTCEFADSTPNHGDILDQKTKGEKVLLPDPVTFTGLVYAVRACLHYKDTLNKKDAGNDDLRLYKVRVSCPTTGFEFCSSTKLCHPADTPCDPNSATEAANFEKINGPQTNEKYDLSRFLEGCGCESVFSEIDTSKLLKVEPGDYIAVEITTVFSDVKYYIEGDSSVPDQVIVLDSSFNQDRLINGKLSIEIHFSEEKVIDLKDYATVSEQGSASVVAQIEYNNNDCGCGTLQSSKEVVVQSVPEFLSIDDSDEAGLRGQLENTTTVVVGPNRSGPIKISSTGTDVRYYFTPAQDDAVTVITGDDGMVPEFEIDCGCPAESGRCTHVVDALLKNDLAESYQVLQPITIHCDHCNLPSLTLDLKMKPAAGGDAYQVPSLVGRDENVLITFAKNQACDMIQKCTGSDAEWYINDVIDARFIATELPYNLIERQPNSNLKIEVCQKFCKYIDGVSTETPVRACGSVTFLVSPSKCALVNAATSSIVINKAKTITFASSDPDDLGSCDDCSITVKYNSQDGEPAESTVQGSSVDVDPPTDHGYTEGEEIDMEYCCSDSIANRPNSCISHSLEAISPGAPEIELVETEALKTCSIDCDEFAEFEVDVKCDNCEGLSSSDYRIRWKIKQEGYDCTSAAPDFNYFQTLSILSQSPFKFKTINVCSIFSSPDTEGLCLCVDFSFSRDLGGGSRTLCRFYEQNFGPDFSDSLLQQYLQEPTPSECEPVVANSTLSFDSDLASGIYKPITYNALIDDVPTAVEDSSAPKFTLFLRSGFTDVKIRATDSCSIASYKTISVQCDQPVSKEKVNGMVAGLVITDKKSQSEAISKLASAANDCDEECSAGAANALDGASVDGDDSIIQVSQVANALPLEIMTDDGLSKMGNLMSKSFVSLKASKGKNKARSTKSGSSVVARTLSASNAKFAKKPAVTTTTTSTTTTTAAPSTDSAQMNETEREPVCGSSSAQNANLATTLRTALSDLSSSSVCGLAPGDRAPTVRVTEDNPVFEMNCTRSSNQLFPEEIGTYIPKLPVECDNDSCALCTIRFLGCADPMPAPNAPDSEKISIKLMKIQSEENSDDCSLEVVKVRDLPLDETIEFTNKNLDPIKVPMDNSELTLSNNYLAVDVEVSTPNSGLIIDFCLNSSMLQATELIVRGRYNFSRYNWTEEDFSMEFTTLTNATETGDEFTYVFDPRTFNVSLDSVKQDGMGVIPEETRDECLKTATVVDQCYRVFVSGFTLADQIGDWSIIVMAQFPQTADETTIQSVETIIYSTSCLYYDESISEYTSVGTSPSPNTNCAEIRCKTTHLSSFGGSFLVPPNNLDVMNSLKMLGSLNENPTVFVTIMVVLGLYIFISVWCRRKDKKDEKKLGIAFLADNDPNDTYQYDITVYTGIGGDAGTSSNVTVVLCGDQMSRPHVLFEEGKELFCSGSVDSFILTTPKCLGDMESIQVWHNNKGNQPSWYLKHIVVKDLQNNKQFIFLNNRWLAVDKDDGQVEREIPVASDTELKDFTTLFKNKVERDLWDGNIWFSVFGRPVRSNFTRVQRAACCLCLLYCTMLANIMFFGAAEADTNTISVLGIELSWTQVMIGLQCNVVIFPVNFLIVYLFKNAKPRIPKELKENEEFKKGKSLVGSRGHHRSGKSMKSFTNLNSASRTSIQSAGQMTVSHTSMFKSNKSKKPSLLDKIKGMFGKKPKKQNPLDASTCSIESVINEPPPDQLEDGKKPKGLPWWTVIIAWVLMGFVSFVAAFFTLLYGMQYGKSKSNLWLKTFLMGFFESLFFVQPIKMICLGLFFALLIKKPEQPDPKEQQRMEIIEHTSEKGKSIVELDYSDYKRQYKKLQKAYVKPLSTDIEAARKYREKMKRMWDALFEIGRYFFFLFLLSTIVNAQTDPRAYLMTENIRNMFTTGTKWPGITKYGDVWTWMYTSLIPGLYNQQWYNGNVTEDIQGFTHDKQSYLVGAARIRQVRMDPLAVCKIPKELQGKVNDCYGDYSLGDGDTHGYGKGWVLPNVTIDADEYYVDEDLHPVGSNPWVYVPQLQADGIPIWGDMNVYGPGGYIMTLNTNMDKALEDVRDLQENNWLDTLTRAIIVEFTVFNPNVNLFSVVSLVVEFSAQGDGYPFEQMKTLRLYPYMSSAGYLVLVCQLAYAAFLIYYMWIEAKEIKQLKWKYLRQFWNWVEIVIIALSWTSFGLLLSYLVGVKVTMNQIKEYSDTRFISFGGPATVNESYKIASAATVYFGYLKLMHMLRFNKKMSSFAQVLKVAANDITNFMIMFTVVFVAFAQFAYLVLGAAVSGYKSFITTSTTLMAMLLGQWDYYEVEEADRLLGPGFLFTYIIAANLILLNVFLSIICEACDQVNGEVAQQENDFEVVDFMMGQVKMLIGADRLLQNANKKMEEDEDEDNKEENKSVDIDAIMCDFEGQMNYISGHYCGSSDDEEDDEINKMLDDYDERSLLQGSEEHSHSFSTRSFNIAVQK